MASYAWAKIYCDMNEHPLLRDRPDCDFRLAVGLILDARRHTVDGVLRGLNAATARRWCHISAPLRQVQAGLAYLIEQQFLVPVPGIPEAYEIRKFLARQAAQSGADRTRDWKKRFGDETSPVRQSGPVTKRHQNRRRIGNETSTDVDADKNYVDLAQGHEEPPRLVHSPPVGNAQPEDPLEVQKALERARTAAGRKGAARLVKARKPGPRQLRLGLTKSGAWRLR